MDDRRLSLCCAYSYTAAITGDGINNQQNNPEVAVDVSRPNSLLNEQVYALKTITSKLRNAYNGMDVEWIDMGEYIVTECGHFSNLVTKKYTHLEI